MRGDGLERVTILNVDDYEPGRYARSRLLRSFGFEVREAKTGAEALSVVATEPPALVILDVNLPDISGFEVCRRLKESATTATLPVLHMSATYTGALDKVQGLEGGADAYLTEPVEPPVLLATVNALLRMKRAEEAQRVSARQWQTTFDALSDGVALLDAVGVIVRSNQVFRDLLADGDGDPAGRSLSGLLDGGSGHTGDSPFARMRRSGRRETAEVVSRGRSLRVAVDPVHHAGLIAGAVCTVADITDRQRIEEERVRLLGREQAARAAAEAANRSKEEFIAMLAHELRNPLAPIRMAMRTLRGPAERDPDVRRATEVIERQSRHLARLLDDLLDAARLAREKIELRKSATTLQDVVTEALEATRELVDTRGHTVTLSLPATPVWLEADPMRLAQVVGNLLNNAAKYTPPGGRIAVAGETDGGEAVLRVRDTGIGMPPETLTRIFDLFAQGDRTLAHSEGGLGIGLTLARMLVQLHGGTLTASSAGAGHGSEFVMRLPRGAPAATEGRSAIGPGQRTVSRRVLVIEDDEDTREMMRLTLEHDGHRVETAASAAEGVELALRTSPDAVLVDIGLPSVDGYAVAQRIRAGLGGFVLLVAVTGYGREDDRRRAAAAGFDAHLVKPLDHESLRRLLADSRHRDETGAPPGF
jgi:signal transduction histidine kinase/DNA-binding response OmpR family regulator